MSWDWASFGIGVLAGLSLGIVGFLAYLAQGMSGFFNGQQSSFYLWVKPWLYWWGLQYHKAV